MTWLGIPSTPSRSRIARPSKSVLGNTPSASTRPPSIEPCRMFHKPLRNWSNRGAGISGLSRARRRSERRGGTQGLCNEGRYWAPIHYPCWAYTIPIFGPLTWRMDIARWQGSTPTTPGCRWRTVWTIGSPAPPAWASSRGAWAWCGFFTRRGPLVRPRVRAPSPRGKEGKH